MVLVYIDESGTTSINDPENKIYVLTAILIKEQNYKHIDIGLSNFKELCASSYGLPQNFEIHIKDLFKPAKIFKKFSLRDRTNIFTQIFKLLSILDFNFISIAILKDKLSSSDDVRFLANLNLIEIIHTFLQDLKQNNYGIIFMDNENEKWNQQKIEILRESIFDKNFLPNINIENIIPTIYFLESGSSMGIQIADIVCYSIRRWLRHTIYKIKTKKDKLNNKGLSLIKSKLYNYPNCIQIGLKLFPEAYLKEIKDKLLKV